jgi:hypothetical protein
VIKEIIVLRLAEINHEDARANKEGNCSRSGKTRERLD